MPALDPRATRIADQLAEIKAARAAVQPLNKPFPGAPVPFDPFFFGLEATPVASPDPK